MRHPITRAACAALALGACAAPLPLAAQQAAPPDPVRLVRDAAAALGGPDRIAAVRTLRIEGTATAYNLGQDIAPESTGQTFVGPYTRRLDLPAARGANEHVRTPTFRYFAGQAAQKQSQPIPAAEVHHHPVAALGAALDPSSTLTNVNASGQEVTVDVTTGAGVRLTLAVDRTTSRPARVITRAAHPNLGDVAIETTFGDYQDSGGLLLPRTFTTRTDRWTTLDVRAATTGVNADVGELAAPPAPAAAAAPAITVTELGQGV